MRAGNQGLERGEVDFNHAVIYRVGVGGQRRIVALPSLGPQKGAGDLIRRENGGGGPQLGAHVGNRRALGHRQRGNALAAPFNDRADAPLDREDAQNFQAHIFCRDKGAQPAGEVDADHFRHCDVICAASHGHGHIQPARAEGQHPDAAAGGGVAVRADQGLSRNAEALQVHLMADAVARTREIDAVLAADRLNVAVVVGVFKAGLQGVVVDVGHAALGPDAVDAHGLKFQISHGAGCILGQGLVNAQGNFAARRHVPLHQVRADDFLCDGQSHIGFSFSIRYRLFVGSIADIGLTA